jgi:branched-chain amino acid transport system ATP-binding protein
MSEPLITFRGVKTGYGQMEVLHGIDLDIHEGEIVTLIGSNGAGKTTTLMTLSGVNRVWEGEILYRGKSLNAVPPHEIVARGISQVPEGRQVFRDLTVTENLRLGAYLRDDEDVIQEDLLQIQGMFPILDERADQLGGTLSGGEQQMLAIGRALMARPKVLLLDEPSLGLAPLIVKDIFETVERINKEGVTVLLVEQNANLALKLADRGYVIETGRITLSDDAKALAANPKVREAYLGGE